jgi:hypothetical protein
MHNETAGSPFAVILGLGDEMERDSFDAAIDEILAITNGDIRLALRAVLVESVLLEEELRQMRAASPHANSIETNNSPQFSKPQDACNQTSRRFSRS